MHIWRDGAPLEKPAGVRCPHQKHHKGCSVYADRPAACRAWVCEWLDEEDTADLSRPDRSHYVIDSVPDVIRAVEANGSHRDVLAVQVWVDPKFRDAHRDPALRAYLMRRGAQGFVAMIRYSEKDGFVLIPPNMTSEKQWREQRGEMQKRQGHDLNPDNWRKEQDDGVDRPLPWRAARGPAACS